MRACFDFLEQKTEGGGGGGGMGSPSPLPCHIPESYAQLCLSRRKLMHVLNEDAHLDLY